MVEKLICLHNEIQLVTKINTFFIVFHLDDDEHGGGGFKDQKKQNSFQILVHIRICNFFFFFVLSSFFFFSLRPFCISGRVCTDREGRFHPPARPSVCLSVLSVRPSCSSLRLDLLCRVLFCFLFLFPASCLSVGGAVVVSVSSTQGRQGQSFGYVHIHGRSMASNKQQHYFRRSSTHTWDRGAEGFMCEAEKQLSWWIMA